MIGFILLILIGLFFYDFAMAHKKSAWGWALGGVVFYYIAVITCSFIIGMVIELIDPGLIDTLPIWVFTLIEIASGIFGVWILYRLLKKKWSNESRDNDMDGFLDAGL